MHIIYKISIVLFLSIATTIAEPSYFFSDKESNAILNQNLPKKTDKKPVEVIYKLSGILFISPNNWTVWINDKPYSSTGQYKEFSINFVSSCSVKITLKNGHSVTLLLNS